MIERHYLLRLVTRADSVSTEHPVSELFQDAAELWWENEVKAEGLTRHPEYGVAIKTRPLNSGVLMLEVTGEVHRSEKAGPGGSEACARRFIHAEHSWAKSIREGEHVHSERRVCPGIAPQ